MESERSSRGRPVVYLSGQAGVRSSLETADVSGFYWQMEAQMFQRLRDLSTHSPNQSTEPTGGSRSRLSLFVSQRRLPPVAHARRWLREHSLPGR